MPNALQDALESVETYVLNEVQSDKVKIAAWWAGFEPIVADDFNKFVAAMKPIALALITGIAQAALQGPDKLAIVSAQLLAVAQAQAVPATLTMANTLAQQIVASIGLAHPSA